MFLLGWIEGQEFLFFERRRLTVVCLVGPGGQIS